MIRRLWLVAFDSAAESRTTDKNGFTPARLLLLGLDVAVSAGRKTC
jgi:hypothetical protein